MKRWALTLLATLWTAPLYAQTQPTRVDPKPVPPGLSIPALDATDLSDTNYVIFRGRENQLFAPEESLCLWRDTLASPTNYFDTVLSSSGPTFTRGDGKGVYASAGGASSATYITAKKFPIGQLVSSIVIEQHDPVVGDYNDVGVGTTFTTGAETYTVEYRQFAAYRRTETLNSIYLQYDSLASGPVATTPVNVTVTPPFTLSYWENQGEASAWITKDGRWYYVDNQQIPLPAADGFDFESTASLAKQAQLVYFQSNGLQRTTISDPTVRIQGNLGEREHVVVTDEVGEPITDSRGYVFICSDDCGPTEAAAPVPATQGSAYMKVGGKCWLYNPATGRRVENTAAYFQKKNGKTFACQEVSIVYERARGVYHVIVSEWNDLTDRTQLMHGEFYRDVLRGVQIFEEGELTAINTTALGAPFTSNEWFYCSGYRKIGGRWYIAGTVNNGVGRDTYLASGTSLGTMTTLEWRYDDEVTEGGYIWRLGGNYYVVTSNGSSQRILNFDTGAVERTIALAGNGRYSHQVDLLPWVKGPNETEYQYIGFSDTIQVAHSGRGEDYRAGDGTYFTACFGPRIVIRAATGTGREFQPQPEFRIAP